MAKKRKVHENSLKNLKNIGDRSPEEKFAIQSAGGKKSAENRRKKANLRKALELVLINQAPTPKTRKALKELGYEETTEMAVMLSLIRKALTGDVGAIRLISEISLTNAEIQERRQIAEAENIEIKNKLLLASDTTGKEVKQDERLQQQIRKLKANADLAELKVEMIKDTADESTEDKLDELLGKISEVIDDK